MVTGSVLLVPRANCDTLWCNSFPHQWRKWRYCGANWIWIYFAQLEDRAVRSDQPTNKALFKRSRIKTWASAQQGGFERPTYSLQTCVTVLPDFRPLRGFVIVQLCNLAQYSNGISYPPWNIHTSGYRLYYTTTNSRRNYVPVVNSCWFLRR